jgi:phage shock protein C
MYCTKCGVALDEKAKFCAECGYPTTRNAFAGRSDSAQGYPKLSRPREDRKIAGVCSGFARYLGIDVTLVRLIVVILLFCPIGFGLIAYVVSWIIMPNDSLRLPAPARPEPAESSA